MILVPYVVSTISYFLVLQIIISFISWQGRVLVVLDSDMLLAFLSWHICLFFMVRCYVLYVCILELKYVEKADTPGATCELY